MTYLGLLCAEPPHLGTTLQQLDQRALRGEPPILQQQDPICPLQHGAAMRDDQAGHVASPAAKGPLPEELLGLHVQRARDVVQNQQLWLAHEHPRRCRTLGLPAGEFHPPHADHRVQPVRKFGHVALENGAAHGA